MATAKLNLVPYDFQSLEVDIGVQGVKGRAGTNFGILTGLDEIEYTTTINREKIYGTSRLPILRTMGDVEFDGSLTMHKYWWDFIVDQCRALNLPLIKLEMAIAVSYFAEDQQLKTDTIIGAALAEIGNSGSKGPDSLMVNNSLDIMNIFYNGVDLLGNRLA